MDGAGYPQGGSSARRDREMVGFWKHALIAASAMTRVQNTGDPRRISRRGHGDSDCLQTGSWESIPYTGAGLSSGHAKTALLQIRGPPDIVVSWVGPTVDVAAVVVWRVQMSLPARRSGLPGTSLALLKQNARGQSHRATTNGVTRRHSKLSSRSRNSASHGCPAQQASIAVGKSNTCTGFDEGARRSLLKCAMCRWQHPSVGVLSVWLLVGCCVQSGH
jgi:hypothetical protein